MYWLPVLFRMTSGMIWRPWNLSLIHIYLASDYFLNRLGEDETDVRWGIMDNDEYWVDNEIERKGACYKYMGSTTLDVYKRQRFIKSINLHPWRSGVVPSCSNTGLINAGFIE